MDVALVTCLQLPEPDPDAAPLAAALDAAGIDAQVLAWDDPASDWSRAPLSVVRSPWNYAQQRDAFLDWSVRASATSELWNGPDVLRWNTHKGYLLELEAAGLPITPTVLLNRGSAADLGAILAERSWREVVVKPAVSAGSFKTRHVAPAELEAGQAHLDQLLSEREVLIQPYLPSVQDHGERALIWIDGELTHAVRKSPRFEGQHESVSESAVAISRAEAELARRVVAAVPWPLLYARIDMAPGADSEPVLMELELAEPSLFFDQGPAALERFVAGIARRLNDVRDWVSGRRRTSAPAASPAARGTSRGPGTR